MTFKKTEQHSKKVIDNSDQIMTNNRNHHHTFTLAVKIPLTTVISKHGKGCHKSTVLPLTAKIADKSQLVARISDFH